MFGTVLTIFSTLFLAGEGIRSNAVSTSRRENARCNNDNFYFDSKNIFKSVDTDEPVFNHSVNKEKFEITGAKTGRVYATIDNERSRIDKQSDSYNVLNETLKRKNQKFYWKYNKNWDYVNRKGKRVMVWGQVDSFNGKYIKNIVPVSIGFDIIYANENHYGVRINSMNEIDHRIISNEEYRTHYYMFRKQRLI